MHMMKRILSVIVVATMLLGCFTVTAFAAKKTDIVKDGLVIWYDASNNSNGIQDHEATVWKDLTGNGNHMTVKIDDNNYWTDNAFHVDANPTYFPDGVLEVINGKEYTVEMVLGEVSFTATDWVTLMCSDNDEFSLFVRQENDVLEYKYNDDNRDRPEIADGGNLIKNSTLTIAFDMTDPAEPLCTIYVNGVAMDTGIPEYTNIADTLMWGHDHPQRVWGGNVHGFRFYNRCLTAEEVADNASADEKNYRNGDYFEPTVEYDGKDEAIGGEDGITYRSDVLVLSESTSLVSTIGEYGCDNIHYMHLYGEHQGIKVMPTTNDDGTITGDPVFYVNYSKFVRRAGLVNLTGDEIKYVAVKLRVVGMIEDIEFWGLAGDDHSRSETDASLADDFPVCNGETEYMLFDMEDAWTGLINNFAFRIVNPDPDAIVYIEEIALFTDAESAYTYAGRIAAEETTEEDTTEAPTDAPAEETEAPAEDTTAAPAIDVTEEATSEETAGGCGSVMGFAVIVVLGAAFVAMKKERD